MGSMRDIPPNPENGEFLLPSDVYNEISFYVIQPKENSYGSCFIDVVKGNGGGSNLQPSGSIDSSSTHILPSYKGFEETEGLSPAQQGYTWAQIVKGDPKKQNPNLRGTGVFLPQVMPSSVETPKAKGKEICMNHEQVNSINSKMIWDGKNMHDDNQESSSGKEKLDKQEESRIAFEISLPEKWTY